MVGNTSVYDRHVQYLVYLLPFTQKDWMGDGHDISEDLLWTIVKNLELAEEAATQNGCKI